MSQEWEVPGGTVLRLTADELSLIDWLLCMYSHTFIGDIDDYMKCHDLRMDVWECLDLLWDAALSRSKEGTVIMPMTESWAKVLLSLAPTTHRWGTGFDCGFSLKRKLFRYLKGVNTDDNPTSAPAQNQAPNSASDES